MPHNEALEHVLGPHPGLALAATVIVFLAAIWILILLAEWWWAP